MDRSQKGDCWKRTEAPPWFQNHSPKQNRDRNAQDIHRRLQESQYPKRPPQEEGRGKPVATVPLKGQRASPQEAGYTPTKDRPRGVDDKDQPDSPQGQGPPQQKGHTRRWLRERTVSASRRSWKAEDPSEQRPWDKRRKNENPPPS